VSRQALPLSAGFRASATRRQTEVNLIHVSGTSGTKTSAGKAPRPLGSDGSDFLGETEADNTFCRPVSRRWMAC
jgi:hypothetical protein